MLEFDRWLSRFEIRDFSFALLMVDYVSTILFTYNLSYFFDKYIGFNLVIKVRIMLSLSARPNILKNNTRRI